MTQSVDTPRLPNHTLAIVSLVLGILGLTQFLPLVGPIGAIVAGKLAQKEIRERPDLYSGDNLARAGVLLGWIGIAIFVIGLFLIGLAILFFMPVSVGTS